ncbi:MAG: hypothetical protein ACYCZI_13130 [Metallibacterium scheffleri]
MKLQDTIFDAIRQAMPADAHIDITSSVSSFHVTVAWPLNDDLERPHKMSKTISIHVSHEAAQDFATAPEHLQSQVRNRVTRFLQTRLSTFDQNHNAPRNVPPPVERWDITTQTLFG